MSCKNCKGPVSYHMDNFCGDRCAFSDARRLRIEQLEQDLIAASQEAEGFRGKLAELCGKAMVLEQERDAARRKITQLEAVLRDTGLAVQEIRAMFATHEKTVNVILSDRDRYKKLLFQTRGMVRGFERSGASTAGLRDAILYNLNRELGPTPGFETEPGVVPVPWDKR